MLLALRPYAKPRGEGFVRLSGLRRTFSFVAGNEETISFSWERPEQFGRCGEDGGYGAEGITGEGHEARLNFAPKKQVMWAFSPEPPVSLGSVENTGKEFNDTRKGIRRFEGLAQVFSPGMRNMCWQKRRS